MALLSSPAYAADRYWVGGGGSWGSTSKWSTSSGGSSGASVPNGDNCYFDGNSGAGTVNAGSEANVNCAALSFSGATLTLTPPTGNINVSGNLTFGAGITFGASTVFRMTGNGTTVTWADFIGSPTIKIDPGAGNTVSLANAWGGETSTFKLVSGTFATAGFDLDVYDVRDGGASTSATLDMGDSVFNIYGSLWFGDGGDITTVPGTSLVRIKPGGGMGPHGKELYDITIEAHTSTIIGAVAVCHSLTLEPGANVQLNSGGLSDYQPTTFSCAGTSGLPITITGEGATATLNAVNQVSCTYATIEDVHCDGTVPCLADANSVDSGGNVNWCFGGGCSSATYTPTVTPTATRSGTVTPTVTQTPTITQTPPPGCCGYASGEMTCVDNSVEFGGVISSDEDCTNLVDPILGQTHNSFNASSYCVDGACPSGPTNTPTTAPTATPTLVVPTPERGSFNKALLLNASTQTTGAAVSAKGADRLAVQVTTGAVCSSYSLTMKHVSNAGSVTLRTVTQSDVGANSSGVFAISGVHSYVRASLDSVSGCTVSAWLMGISGDH